MGYTTDADWSASGNTNGNMGDKVGFCLHHAAGTSINMAGTFLANGTSAHYGVEPGHVRQFLDDNNNAWAAGHTWANNSLIHIECVNSGGDAQGWPVADGTVDTLVEFLADKCREHGFGELVIGQNLYGHRDFYATFCPGVLYNRLGEITSRVNAQLAGTTSTNDESEISMQCIFSPGDRAAMYYFDGSAIHYLSHPDQVSALNQVYNQCHGRDIPCFEWGTVAEYPIFGRLNEAVTATVDGGGEWGKWDIA